jgi:hydrogenase-4 membrane subunit HyfE
MLSPVLQALLLSLTQRNGIRQPIKFTHFERGTNEFSVLLNTAIE